MITEEELKKIKDAVEEFFQKMTIASFELGVHASSIPVDAHKKKLPGDEGIEQLKNDLGVEKNEDVVEIDIKNLVEPQMLIGQGGQTLVEIQRILRILLNKKLVKQFYVKLDINKYRAQKIEYLKNLAKELAGEAIATGQKKVLPPMSAYERRIVHSELAGRSDIFTESQGSGADRYVVISPR